MIWVFVICLVILVLVLELKGAEWSLSRLHYDAECSTLLAEPGETITFTSHVENRSLLPALYIQLSEYLPAEAALHAEEDWMAAHTHLRPDELCVSDITFLLPRRRRTASLSFTLPRRGWYRLGRATVCAGDFLGIRESFRRDDAKLEVVVIPERSDDPDIMRSLGGFLGDISVRRFILEDPVLTVGFREYTGREPMKAISWNQSARTGVLQVKQYDHTVDITVSVILNSEGGTREQMEQCYRITRTVCEELEAKGIPYEFRTNGDLTGPVDFLHWVAEGLGQQHLRTILYGLGRGNCRHIGSLDQLIRRAVRRARSNQGYIVITPPLSAEKRQCVERLRANGSTLCVLTGEEVDA